MVSNHSFGSISPRATRRHLHRPPDLGSYRIIRRITVSCARTRAFSSGLTSVKRRVLTSVISALYAANQAPTVPGSFFLRIASITTLRSGSKVGEAALIRTENETFCNILASNLWNLLDPSFGLGMGWSEWLGSEETPYPACLIFVIYLTIASDPP